MIIVGRKNKSSTIEKVEIRKISQQKLHGGPELHAEDTELGVWNRCLEGGLECKSEHL